MASYETQLVGCKLFTLMATMQSRCKKQEYDLKEKGLELLNKLLNSLPEQLEKDEQSSNAKSYQNHPYANFIINYFFKKFNNPLDLLEGDFLFSFIPAIEFIISLNDIDTKEPLIEQKIQDLFFQIKRKSEEMFVRSINENSESDYTKYTSYNIMLSNQIYIVKRLEEIIAYYHSLGKKEQSKIPLIKMINLDKLE